MKIKNAMTLVLAMLIALTLTACGSDNNSSGGVDRTARERQSPSVSETQERSDAAPETPSEQENEQKPSEPAQEPFDSDDPKHKAIAILDALDCPLMDEAENRVGIRVLGIEKVDDGYKIYWDSDLSGGNTAFIFSLMRFFDPDDYSNNYQPFTITDGGLEYTFGAGDVIGYDEFRVRGFEPDCGMFYLYFAGALESMGAPPEIRTDPLFFTFLLGDDPMLVEDAPRRANRIFDDYIPLDTPDQGDGIPDEYIGKWEGSVDDIYLTFSIYPDATGIYTFEQNGYFESYDFTLEVGMQSFTVNVPENNTLGIAKVEGTYEYSDITDMLTLDIRTSFQNGGVFEYTVACRRA